VTALLHTLSSDRIFYPLLILLAPSTVLLAGLTFA
jgi:hypothetical protein